MFVRPDEASFVTSEMIRERTLTGTVDELRETIRQLRDAGYDQLAIQIVPGQEGALDDWARVFEDI